jgi:hypothetical protein
MSGRDYLTRGTSLLLLAVAVAALLYFGCVARRWTWDHTAAIRFESDMHNAWNWGSRAAREGYWPLYDRVVAEHPDGRYGLDYVPLRLAVMTLWAGQELKRDPNVTGWKDTYEFNRALLWFNTTMELAAAGAVFVLARMWLRRSGSTGFLTAEWLALIGFAMAWLNPASLLSAHARPTWDAWVAPFYLWAMVAACANWWMLAGCIVAAGAMLKGQQLIAAPVFLVWPLLGLRFGAAARWVLGLTLTSALIVSPWIVPMRPIPIGFIAVLTMIGPAFWLIFRRSETSRLRFPARWLSWMVPAMLAVALWSSAWVFEGSFNWFRVAFAYGAEKYGALEVGGASSLASILQNRFGWHTDMHAWTVPWVGIDLTIDALMIAMYGVLLVVSCLAIRLSEIRKDKAFLLAMAAPWIVYFCVFPKMHERYLLWGAIAACAAASVGLGPALLAVFFSLCQTNMSLYQLLASGNSHQFLYEYSPTLGRSLRFFARGSYPGLAWAILLAAGIWLYLSFSRSRAAGKT